MEEVGRSWLLFQSIQFNPMLVVLIVGLLIVSAFFSMSETAFSSIGRLRMKTLVELKTPGSKKALWIVENFNRALTTLLVGNNLANIALATVSVILFTGIFSQLPNPETIVTLVNTVAMTIIILIFGEIMPKSFAKSHAERLCLGISGFLYFLIKVMTPITYPFLLLNKKVMKKMTDPNRVSVTEYDLETIIDTMEEEGSIDGEEADMLQKVLDLSDISVEEIMTPRVDMMAVEVNEDIETIKDLFFKHKFSRMPIYEGTKDNIIGVLSERDFYTKLLKEQNINLKRLMMKPIFIPASTKVDTLIELLQSSNVHIAFVVDEYGGVDGIVTMEDALEELVGEIYDEHDDIMENIIPIDENHFQINADMDTEDLFEELNLGEPPLSDSTSVGGWLFELFQDIPEIDEEIEYNITYNKVYDELSELASQDEAILIFRVLKVKKRRIKQVLLTINKIEPDAEA